MNTDDWVKKYTDSYDDMTTEDSKVKDFIDSDHLKEMGIKCGPGSYVHKTALIYFPEKITIGSYVRIDAFSILSPGDGFIKIGNYCHISSYCMFIGTNGITLEDYACTGAGTKVYSVSDKFSGNALIGPMVPENYRELVKGPARLEKYTSTGVNCTMMPNSVLSEGCLMHSNSLLLGKSTPYMIIAGQPAVTIKERPREFLKFVEQHSAPSV